MLDLQVTALSREGMVVGMTREAKGGMVGDSKVSFLTACGLRMTCSTSLRLIHRPQDRLLHHSCMQVTEAPMSCITSSISMHQCLVMPPRIGQELSNPVWPHMMFTYVDRSSDAQHRCMKTRLFSHS